MSKKINTVELLNNYTNLDLQILPTSFKKNGFNYELVLRDPKKCMYAQSVGGRLVAYEVFKNKIDYYRAKMIKMKQSTGRGNDPENLKEYREIFPLDEDFGKRAWSFRDYDQAYQCYEGL